jgi:hypothetical protein
VENTDLFESQLKEILDSGPDTKNPAPDPRPELPTTAAPASPGRNKSGSLSEIIIQIAALAAVIGLLIGFAMRITSF